MEKIVCTIAMCIISVCLNAQEKVQKNESLTKTSKQAVDTTGQPLKPRYIDTGNPVEDQKKYEESKTEYYRSVSQQNSGSNSGPRTKAVVEKEISQVDSHINSIKIKREHILKDPKTTEEAEKSGWFKDMNATQERLEKKKTALQEELKSL